MPDIDPNEALLRLLEAEPELARALDLVADFDVARRDPVENLAIPAGLPLAPIAGDAGGGTYFLVGGPQEARRPVLYADSEGGGALIGEDLVEALAVMIALGFWRDAGGGFPLEEVEQELRECEPDIDTLRAGLYAATGIAPLTAEQARDRLLAAAARTAPDYVPIADFPDAEPYDVLFATPRGSGFGSSTSAG